MSEAIQVNEIGKGKKVLFRSNGSKGSVKLIEVLEKCGYEVEPMRSGERVPLASSLGKFAEGYGPICHTFRVPETLVDEVWENVD